MQYQELGKRQWEVTLSHIYREVNTKLCCGLSANFGYSFVFGFHIFYLHDRGMSNWFRYDVIGVSLLRSVSVLNNI
ncbi:hypothetical protein LINGRAHAP2_LOCUS28528 [Linum grandiflorum]